MTMLRTENSFADHIHWQDLAREKGIRLPLWRMACTTGGMRRFLKKLGVTVDEYLSANDERNLKVFAKKNPTWPLRAWVGIQLENLDFTARLDQMPKFATSSREVEEDAGREA